MNRLTRREALQLTTAVALSRLAKAADAEPGFNFLVVNDLHSIDEGCAAIFRDVVAKMRESAPAAQLCLEAGDLADSGTAAQLKTVHESFAELRMPLYAVPGNHDFISESDRSGYDEVFPERINYRFTHRGWQFVALDSTEGLAFEGTRVGEHTLAWLDAALPKLDPDAPTVVFTHFPLGDGVAYRPLNASAVLERLAKLNLRAVFSGHWHGQSERRVGSADLFTNRCCARLRNNHDGSPQKGWFVCHAAPDGTLTRRFVAL